MWYKPSLWEIQRIRWGLRKEPEEVVGWGRSWSRGGFEAAPTRTKRQEENMRRRRSGRCSVFFVSPGKPSAAPPIPAPSEFSSVQWQRLPTSSSSMTLQFVCLLQSTSYTVLHCGVCAKVQNCISARTIWKEHKIYVFTFQSHKSAPHCR